MTKTIVLCYHAVSPSWPSPLAVTPQRLERQLRSLAARGYRGVTFTEAVQAPAERTVAVTFDDAYRSVWTLAQPILARIGMPGTVFVPTAFAGIPSPMAWPGIDGWVDGPHARELIPMTWDELAELAANGWEIGSHTHTHPHLPELAQAEIKSELERSRRECESHLGAPCTSIAYPYGDHNPAVVAAASAAGYLAAGAISGRVREPQALLWPREPIYRGDGAIAFRLKVSPWIRRLRATRAWGLRFAVGRRTR